MAESFNDEINPSKPTVDTTREALNASFKRLIGQAKKNEKSEKETDNIEAFKTLIKDSVVSHLNARTAPWLKSHDGKEEKSFFPSNNYTPSGITAIWLKMQEQQLGTNDPRWYSHSDIVKANKVDGKIRIKPHESGTVMSFKDGDTVRYSYYFNASQLTGVPPYIPQYEKSEQNPSLYHPQKVNNTFHPKETLRSDLTNWFNSLETHTPFTPHGLNRVQDVSKFLENSKGGTFFFIAKDASATSQKMLQTNKEKVSTLSKNQGTELG